MPALSGVTCISGPRAFAAAQANLNKAGTLLDADQDGLTDSAAYYRQTDTNAAVRLDATLPAHPDRTGLTALEQAWAGNICSPSFADSRDPSGRLTAVGDVTGRASPYPSLESKKTIPAHGPHARGS
ncbi:hypothetical protein [Actinoplanes sp. NPDC051494]|uniref:hypothetical protein n=1 Tax=Actinoplanes sp. NPDC051494 TaxID=3363907 RepID=UPI0037933890